jgi:hypothetical protein
MNETLCPVSAKRKLYLYGMNDEKLQMMMLDIDGVLTRHHADTADVLAAAQQMAVSAIGDLANKGNLPDTLLKAADAIAEQIRAALHARIAEGPKPDW